MAVSINQFRSIVKNTIKKYITLWGFLMIVIYVVLMLFTNRLVQMSYEEDINRIKHKRVIKGLPHELEVAIQTFIDQFIIMIDEDLDSIPHQYVVNLLTTLSKYPEHRPLLFDLLNIMGLPMEYGEA
jgi:hypothetical protein